MSILKLIADLQINPLNQVAYRRIAEHYAALGRPNEAAAFEELLKRKFSNDREHDHVEQRIEPTTHD